uniref:Family with sequence similarity 210 member Aa n=1 Tax=Paramormyrops kingsleyae TaxID=1676925 RepID=A0A3B3R254_9TELE
MQQLVCHRAWLRLVALQPTVQGLSHSPVGPRPWTGKRGPSLCYVSTSEVARAASPTQKERMNNPEQPGDSDPLQDKSIGLVQRFKKMLKQYGKVMIPVHLVTSSLWFGAFYYTAMKGVNVVPFLEYIGLPDKLVDLMEKSQSGYAITAYAMYKIATPARYTVTLAGTSLSVKYLRKHGYMSTPPPVKEYIQDKMEETREISGKMEETKDRLSGRMEETKDKFSEKLQQTKDKVSFRKKDQGP